MQALLCSGQASSKTTNTLAFISPSHITPIHSPLNDFPLQHIFLIPCPSFSNCWKFFSLSNFSGFPAGREGQGCMVSVTLCHFLRWSRLWRGRARLSRKGTVAGASRGGQSRATEAAARHRHRETQARRVKAKGKNVGQRLGERGRGAGDYFYNI